MVSMCVRTWIKFTRNTPLTLNCDGVPVFKSSQYGIWPLQGMVNELPYHVRKENVLLFGLWFGTKKAKC